MFCKSLPTSVSSAPDTAASRKVDFARRKFLAATAAFTAYGFVPSWGLASPKSVGNCFSLEEARLVAAGLSTHVSWNPHRRVYGLNFQVFTRYAQEALDHLAEHPPGSVSYANFGFKNLSPEGALALAQLKIGFLELPSLAGLEADTAAAMRFVGKNPPVLVVGIHSPLSANAAEAFAFSQRETDIDLFLPALDADTAMVLSRHTGGLTALHIRNEPISVEAASLLAYHQAPALWLDLAVEPTGSVIQALACNPATKLEFISKSRRFGHRFMITPVSEDDREGSRPIVEIG